MSNIIGDSYSWYSGTKKIRTPIFVKTAIQPILCDTDEFLTKGAETRRPVVKAFTSAF